MSAPALARTWRPRRARGDLEVIARYAAVDLAGASAQAIVQWAATVFPGRVVATQSMANTSLAHLIGEIAPGIPVVFLDTGYHFPETLATRDELAARTKVRLLSIAPRASVEEQDAEHGPELHRRDPNLCCRLRKVEPMEELLDGYEAWITGMRYATAAHRRGTRTVVEFDDERGVVKIAPILHWTDEQLLRYTLEHDIPVNPLMYDGYPSIGCAPCTARVEPGADPRSGRWRGFAKTECGLHR